MAKWNNPVRLIVGILLAFASCFVEAGCEKPNVGNDTIHRGGFLTFDRERVLELGTVILDPNHSDATFEQRISIRNSTKQELRYTKIGTSCGCLDAKIEPSIIPPGQAGVLVLQFATASARGRKTFLITIEQSHKAPWQVTINGDFIRKCSIEPPGLVYNSLAPYSTTRGRILIKILRVGSTVDAQNLKIEFEDPVSLKLAGIEFIGSEQINDGQFLDQFAIETLVKTKDANRERVSRVFIRGHDGELLDQYQVRWSVQSPVSIFPQTVTFSNRQATAKFAYIRANDNKAFRLTNAKYDDRLLEVTWERSASASLHKIEVNRKHNGHHSTNSAISGADSSNTIIIETDHPSVSQVLIHVGFLE
ncbi:DUF1573 domain-containing protein [Singulisphaera acidiphila]|uniref:DUF1573 domain-containing protein n=1 Tax=Singulisphaera acidiphila (strain ATCC BAA-1392 / DSM 18658 / VKM B-2454 / MOB10) TaxID=886293 RepID=L0DNC9_SINAD|nr:DUF1573 domain-containing protein [Singulisphaera acidiphila]AGA30348.1 Protein of unknown function (DUF1573) [Singulisphaera acidiphila DSM 18658]